MIYLQVEYTEALRDLEVAQTNLSAAQSNTDLEARNVGLYRVQLQDAKEEVEEATEAMKPF